MRSHQAWSLSALDPSLTLYADPVLSSLRGPDGRPALRVRVLAALVVLGLVALTAPLVLVPVLDWLVDFVL